MISFMDDAGIDVAVMSVILKPDRNELGAETRDDVQN
jgi:hypothetical protein